MGAMGRGMVEPFGVDRIADHEREIRVIKRMMMDLEERFRAAPGGGGGEEPARLRQDVEALKQLVDQISSREGVTLHRLETLRERIEEFMALGREMGEWKKSLGASGGAQAGAEAGALAALQESVQEVRQHLDLLRAAQAAQAKRLDGLKEDGAKLWSEHKQLEAQAHAALEALRERVENVEQPRPAAPAPPRRPAARSNLEALRERAARVAELSAPSDLEDGEGDPPPRGGRGRARREPE